MWRRCSLPAPLSGHGYDPHRFLRWVPYVPSRPAVWLAVLSPHCGTHVRAPRFERSAHVTRYSRRLGGSVRPRPSVRDLAGPFSSRSAMASRGFLPVSTCVIRFTGFAQWGGFRGHCPQERAETRTAANAPARGLRTAFVSRRSGLPRYLRAPLAGGRICSRSVVRGPALLLLFANMLLGLQRGLKTLGDRSTAASSESNVRVVSASAGPLARPVGDASFSPNSRHYVLTRTLTRWVAPGRCDGAEIVHAFHQSAPRDVSTSPCRCHQNPNLRVGRTPGGSDELSPVRAAHLVVITRSTRSVWPGKRLEAIVPGATCRTGDNARGQIPALTHHRQR